MYLIEFRSVRNRAVSYIGHVEFADDKLNPKPIEKNVVTICVI